MLQGNPILEMTAYIDDFLSGDVLSLSISNDPLSILGLLLIVGISTRFLILHYRSYPECRYSLRHILILSSPTAMRPIMGYLI